MKYLLLLPLTLALASCVSDQGSITAGYWKPASNTDPEARFGYLVDIEPIVIEEGK